MYLLVEMIEKNWSRQASKFLEFILLVYCVYLSHFGRNKFNEWKKGTQKNGYFIVLCLILRLKFFLFTLEKDTREVFQVIQMAPIKGARTVHWLISTML